MAHLLSNLSQVSFHHILVSRHALKLEAKLVHKITKSLVYLCLCLNEVLHQTLQIGLLRWRLSRLKIGSLILEPVG